MVQNPTIICTWHRCVFSYFYLNRGVSGVLVTELKQSNEVTVTTSGSGFPHCKVPQFNVPAP